MRRILRVAQREYVETVRTKTFLMGVLMTPVLIGVILYFSRRAADRAAGPQPASRVAVTDSSGELSERIRSAFEAHNASKPERKILLQEAPAGRENADEAAREQKEKLRRKQIDLYVVMDPNVISGGGMRFYTRAMKPSEADVIPTVGNLLNQVVTGRRCELRNVSPELLAELQRRVPLQRVEVGPSTDDERVRGRGEQMLRMMVPFAFMFLMFMGIFGIGQHMLTSVIEEKNSRVIEVVLSAISPFQLMAGKVLGLGGIGLTVISLWGTAAFAAARWKGLSIDVSAEVVLCFAVYYILGFLLFSSVLAGIGSICNTIKEAQSLMMPLTLIIIVPTVAWIDLARHPEGALARVLSFVPPLTPMVMILRLSAGGDVPVLEVLASILVLGASVLAVVWVAAKVFRTGILMYGKRPGLREVLRWICQA